MRVKRKGRPPPRYVEVLLLLVGVAGGEVDQVAAAALGSIGGPNRSFSSVVGSGFCTWAYELLGPTSSRPKASTVAASGRLKLPRRARRGVSAPAPLV